MPRLRIAGKKVPHKRDRKAADLANIPGAAGGKKQEAVIPGGFDEAAFLSSKQSKEKHLAERARIGAEREAIELAVRKGELVTAEDAQRTLEREHTIWLGMIEEWRQAINKRLSRLGIPVEMQEAISDMIAKETTVMRQKRAVAE